MSRDPSGPSVATDDAGDRRRAARYVLPLLAIGVANLVLLLRWGLDPLWAFAILPPTVFLSGIGWIAFRYGFDERPTGSGSNR
ncbi:hypothetical protein [Natrinema salsiterrestre]|uniref:DUF8142 domain-containing protein n=1 Tax=Natrinema salsiterrestre TaxID=2950540 RepID=A0A9Q4L3M9_9EURY|nr:hypothetical protein [Natrinema salsiterrestre]MDF9746979.1 hypothetical protein [Natrinema salsiterrestre]